MRTERGVVLFEVLVALTILAVAGLSIASVVREQAHALADLRDREVEITRADQVLTRLTLRDRHGLDLRLGRRIENGFVTDVQRPRPNLYRLAVADTLAPNATLLVTVVFRAESQ